jgi:hypothetical protein
MDDDSDSSSILGDASPSMSQRHTDVESSPSMSLSEISIESSLYHDDDIDDEIGADADGADDIFHDQMFCNQDSFISRICRENEKPIKNYTGIVITEDDDFIP